MGRRQTAARREDPPAELEAEAKATAEAKLKAQAEAAEKQDPKGRRKGGRSAAPPSTVPDPKAQKNFTDPQSRIKQARGFRQFLMRGFDQVRAEWAIVCAAHNLLKLAHRRTPSPPCPMVVTVPDKGKGVTKPSHAPANPSSA